jgi:hypothetical protein
MRTALAAVWMVSLTACSALIEPDTRRLGGADGGGQLDPFDAGHVQHASDAGRIDPPAEQCPEGEMRCAGACVSIDTDELNCGACGARCSELQECADGHCRCFAGLDAVGDLCLDLANDPANCGNVGIVCPSGVCRDGACTIVCSGGLVACGNTCADLANDEANCGECFHVCGRDKLCLDARCRDYDWGCDGCGDDKVCCPYEGTSICLKAPHCP